MCRANFKQSEFPAVKPASYIPSTLLVLAATAALSGAALAADFSKDINAPDSIQNASGDAQSAQTASLAGDWTSEVALAGKAYKEDPSLLNEFNLATGYEQLGRTTLAIPLFQDVAARGQYIHVQAVYDYHARVLGGARVRHMDSTLSDESTRRLNLIAGRPAPFNP
jgi:hypothetical protein